MFHVFTDGGRRDSQNPTGVSAWAMVVYDADEMHLGKKSEGFPSAMAVTNNQAELIAVIKAFQFLDRAAASGVVYTDSAYVCNGLNQWVTGWKTNGWRTSQNKPVKNVDLWQTLDKLRTLDVRVQKVKAHTETKTFEGRGNHEADLLCNVEMDTVELDERF